MSAKSVAQKLRLAVLGCGRMGQRHVYNIQHLTPRAEVIAIADPSPTSAQWARANWPEISYHTDPYEIFKLENIDAVVISTSTDTHGPLTLKALEANMHVLLEKPIDIDVEKSRPIVKAAESKPGLKVAIGFVRRYDAALNQLHDLILSGTPGKPMILKSTTCDAYDPSGYFVSYAKASGGIFMDCGIHDIDMARWLLGIGQPQAALRSDRSGLEPSAPDASGLSESQAPLSSASAQVKRVYATGMIARHPELKEQDDCDQALGVVEFTNGTSCTLHLSRSGMNGYESSVDVYCMEQKLSVETPVTNHVKIADGLGRRSEGSPKYIERMGEAFIREMNSFVECCLDDKPVATSPRDALEAAIIAKALTQSYRLGRAIDFDLEGNPLL
ncbi:uncharacterized protein I303_103844 [Kwoniella dejecticola CBS 10117]|uniref:Oxidoreductase n=1 Tax=Kwoniella dejecticola CBS 10117 TaxID=1296121 RepID=A0A1A6A7V8_9TREE|nr:uncharacterized protein I303_03863 [Kwoniella dejecticola CBS 10117]OBR86143.1 hypothetical protein I303_03863 [Kwoniella dejecticola CBS 10117]